MKNYIKIIIITIIVFIFAYTLFYIIQNKTLTASFVEYNEGKGADSFIRCNYNILHPEFATLFQSRDKLYIGFKAPNAILRASKDEWRASRTGGTTVYNLPFSQALQMLKKDCNQFKKNYNWSNRKKETAWIYYPKDNETYDNTETVDFDQYLQEKLNSFKTEKEREEFLEKFKKEKSTKPDLETFLEVIDSIKEN